MEFLFFIVVFVPLVLAASEMEILLEFKQGIDDFAGLLQSWDAKVNPNICSWTGVQCANLDKNVVRIDLSSFYLGGTISSVVCNLPELTSFTVPDNNFIQEFPSGFENCHKLVHLDLSQNRFFGSIPPKLWAIPNMTRLDVSSNQLIGNVTSDIKGAAWLRILKLDSNRFEGALPEELGNLSRLIELSASDNLISGFHFGRCLSLKRLYLSHNLLSGIPSYIGTCTTLSEIDLSVNNLSGQIPSSLGNLYGLHVLDISNNHLSGHIPSVLESLPLSTLNISNNELEGDIPCSWRRSFSSASFARNPNLYSTYSLCRKKWFSVSWGLLLVGGGVILLLLAALCIWLLKSKSRSTTQPPQWKIIPFHNCSFNVFTVIENLDHDNVIGSGRSGKVYRVDLPDAHSVAVKQVSHSNEIEVNILGQIRHRNIIRLLCCCLNASTNLLVFEYMPNGSLRDVLHSQWAATLDWIKRYRVALGVAQALAYLHHDCCPPVLHRDVKSANILLDYDYEPKLADLGIAKLLKSSDSQTMTNFAGSYGYIAPEYAYTSKVDMTSDTYSFGVVLLELVTGKKPVDSEYGDVDIVGWVKGRLKAEESQLVLDPRLSDSAHEQMKMLLQVALLCTRESPKKRPVMHQVVEMLKQIQPNICYYPSMDNLLSDASPLESMSP